MTPAVLIGLILCAAPAAARAERVWLVVGASDSTASGIARKAKTKAKATAFSGGGQGGGTVGGAVGLAGAGGLVVQTTDCGGRKNVFAWTAEIAISAESADLALERTRAKAADAYLKRCAVKPTSLLAFRISAVDPSISDVPDDAVNWSESDKVSLAIPLGDGRALVVVRYFISAPNDHLEGRREKVLLAESTGRFKLLEEDCSSPGRPAFFRGRLAFECAREQAGDNLLHTTSVFDDSGKRLAAVERCRRPRFDGVSTLVCDEEAVGPDGRLKLRPKRVPLPAPTTVR